MSVHDTELDREFAKLLLPAGTPPLHEERLHICEFLEGDNPEAEWTRVIALFHRLEHEHPDLCVGCMPILCVDRGWLSLEPDGPIRQPTHDGSVRRYRITEAGRVAASAVLP
jgi:hypothetical protein